MNSDTRFFCILLDTRMLKDELAQIRYTNRARFLDVDTDDDGNRYVEREPTALESEIEDATTKMIQLLNWPYLNQPALA